MCGLSKGQNVQDLLRRDHSILSVLQAYRSVRGRRPSLSCSRTPARTAPLLSHMMREKIIAGMRTTTKKPQEQGRR
jgi:hypothetical protein